MLACEVALYPLGIPHYSRIIKEALASVPPDKVHLEVGSMSTIIRGEDDEVWKAVRLLFEAAARTGDTVMVLTVSNRCGCS
ncbi:YkoF family thiamine/hydroxymethylpyrimidine-binding protein [Moorellaceae bacterium AZ2]